MHTRNVKLVAITLLTTLVLSIALHSFARASYSSSTSPPDGQGVSVAMVNAYIRDFEMLSATEGWAAAGSAILNYDGKKWKPVAELGEPGLDVSVYEIEMVSSTEGWATGSIENPMLNTDGKAAIWYYDGIAWTKMPALSGSNLEMLNRSHGWMMLPWELLRYNGVAWEVASTIDNLNIPEESSPFGCNCPRFYDIAVTGVDDLWVIVVLSGFAGKPQESRIYHYDGKEWELSDITVGFTPNDLHMVGAADGWSATTRYEGWDGEKDVYTGLVKRYNGANWITQTLPFSGTVELLDSTPDGEILWAFGQCRADCGADSLKLLKFSGSEWQVIDSPVRAAKLEAVSENEVWLSNDGALFRYFDGEWSGVGNDMLDNETVQVVQSGSYLRFGVNNSLPKSLVQICVNGRALAESLTNSSGELGFGLQTQSENAEGGYIVEVGQSLNCVESASVVAAKEETIFRSTFFLQEGAPLNAAPEESPFISVYDLPTDVASIQPSLDISHTTATTSVVVPGGNVTFTIGITNTGAGTLRMAQIISSQLGDITDGDNPELVSTDCLLPLFMAEREVYTCQFSTHVGSEEPTWYTSTVMVDAVSVLSTTVDATASSTVEVASPPDETSDLYLPALAQ